MQFFREKRGFTLIELLVVIAIIGILAAIVLVSLASARDRAKDARITTDMSQLRAGAEVFQGNNDTYAGFCTSDDENTLEADIGAQGGANYGCNATDTAYCVEVEMNGGAWWCIDSDLVSAQTSSDPTCDGTHFYCW
jgi:prepilin-type N-terminal cleavage/methylation domain-containing protein